MAWAINKVRPWLELARTLTRLRHGLGYNKVRTWLGLAMAKNSQHFRTIYTEDQPNKNSSDHLGSFY